jgi:hypothetical protein
LQRELALLAEGRLCGPAQQRRCRTENGPFAAWACQVCEEYLRPEAISPWTRHLVFLHRLRQAGYPFGANDLTLEEWLLLDLVQRILTGKRGRHAQQDL